MPSFFSRLRASLRRLSARGRPARTHRAPASGRRILLVRPDTYGDLILFEPALRGLLETWPKAEVGLLARTSYHDLAALFPRRLEWMKTACEPYRKLPSADDDEVDELRHTVEEFAPDVVVGACFSATWIEYLAAAFAPAARRVRLGNEPLEVGSAQATARALGGLFPSRPAPTLDELEALFPERVVASVESAEPEKGLALVSALTGVAISPTKPRLHVPEPFRREALDWLAERGLGPEKFLAFCPAGTANVPIKAWPAPRFGELIAWAERTLGLPAVVLGAESEEMRIAETVAGARAAGAGRVAAYLGSRGNFPRFAALLSLARAYVGNDTGALHAAAAMERPVAAIYGGGTWPRFLPAGEGAAAAVVQPMECFGCGWDCPFGDAPCLKTIPPEPAQTALTWLLREATPGNRRQVEARALESETAGRLGVAGRRHRLLAQDSAARMRQIVRLTEQLHANSDVPAAASLIVAADDRAVPTERLARAEEQAALLLAEVQCQDGELKLARRVLAALVTEKRSESSLPPA